MAADPYFFLPQSNRLGIWILVAGSFFSPLSSFRPNCERKVSFLDFLRESFHNCRLDLQFFGQNYDPAQIWPGNANIMVPPRSDRGTHVNLVFKSNSTQPDPRNLCPTILGFHRFKWSMSLQIYCPILKKSWREKKRIWGGFLRVILGWGRAGV